MNSVVIDIEEDGRGLGDDIDGFAHRILHFFADPGFDEGDYAEVLLMFIGEDDGHRIPQGLIREQRNLCRQPIDVLRWGLKYVFLSLKAVNPSYSELEFGSYLDNFLTNGTGYAGWKIALKAKSAPYFGRVARTQLTHCDQPKCN